MSSQREYSVSGRNAGTSMSALIQYAASGKYPARRDEARLGQEVVVLQVEVRVRVRGPVPVQIEDRQRVHALAQALIAEPEQVVVEERLPVVLHPELRVVAHVVLYVDAHGRVLARDVPGRVIEPVDDHLRIGARELAERERHPVPGQLHQPVDAGAHLGGPAVHVADQDVVVLKRRAEPDLGLRPDLDAAGMRVLKDAGGVRRPRGPVDGPQERPLHVVLAGLHQPVDEPLRVGKVRVARLHEGREVLDGVQRVRLQPARGRHRMAPDVDRMGQARGAEGGYELLLRVEEARAELLEQRVGACGQVGRIGREDQECGLAACIDAPDGVAVRDRGAQGARSRCARRQPDRHAPRPVGRGARDGDLSSPHGPEVARQIGAHGVEQRVGRVDVDPHVCEQEGVGPCGGSP